MRTLIADIETNALENPTELHCVVLVDYDTDEEFIFTSVTGYDGLNSLLEGTERLVGHNFIDYDYPCLQKLVPGFVYPLECVWDTLVASRMVNYNLRDGHSLEAWGTRYMFPKSDFSDFSKFSRELLVRCQNDVQITKMLYNDLLRYERSAPEAFRVEMSCAVSCLEMRVNGFGFNKSQAARLKQEMDDKAESLLKRMQADFLPKPKPVREIIPTCNKDGTLSIRNLRKAFELGVDPFHISPDAPFTLLEWADFNPGSTVQIVDRLNQSGWKPTERTKGYKEAKRNKDKEKLDKYEKGNTGWTISEENLNTLPDDAPDSIRSLTEYLILTRRSSILSKWIELYNSGTLSIHGNFSSIGTWTHRMSHSNPNMGNIPNVKSVYGYETRDLFVARSGCRLVGVDAKGIQNRVLAHYLDDPVLTKACVSGSEENGDDMHSIHASILGISRSKAKTFLYAWIFGAGGGLLSKLLECSYEEALVADERFMSRYPKLRNLKEYVIPKAAQDGYFFGLDGRIVVVRSEHEVLAGLLQNGEKVIMAHALDMWQNYLKECEVPYKLVNFVHDEWQTEVEDANVVADFVGDAQVWSLQATGNKLKLRCPMDGSKKIGYSWGETH